MINNYFDSHTQAWGFNLSFIDPGLNAGAYIFFYMISIIES